MSVLEAKSKLTDRYQTTIPAEIRQVLGLGKRDDLGYVVTGPGKVALVKASPVAESEADPALGPFLRLIEKDLARHPDKIVPLTEQQAQEDLKFLARRKARRA